MYDDEQPERSRSNAASNPMQDWIDERTRLDPDDDSAWERTRGGGGGSSVLDDWNDERARID